MSNKKAILINIFSSLFQQVTAVIYGFIVPILMIKQYSSAVNGLISSIGQFVSYITLLEMGIGPVIKAALYKPLKNKERHDVEKVLGATSLFFKRISYIFIIYLIVLCFVYPNFTNGFDKIYVISLILIIAIGRFFEYFIGMTYKLFLQANQKNYIIDCTMSISYILSLLVIFIMIKLDSNVHMVKLAGSLIYLIRPLILKFYFEKKYKFKMVKNKEYKLPQQWDGLFHHIASVVQSNTDLVILTIYSSLVNVSIYSIYALITNGIRAIIVALTNGIDAFFGKLLVIDNMDEIRNKFKLYSFCFYSITTIMISSAFVLIIPFITVYTKNVTDANYIYPLFGYIMVLAEYMFVIRYPYSTITYAKGHFKQTRLFSIVEPIVNIILSIILVVNYGLIGVAIGTLVSMIIRSLGFIIYSTKHILKNKLLCEFKLIIVSFVELCIIGSMHLFFGNNVVANYIEWLALAIPVFLIISFFVLLVNAILFKNTFLNLISKFKRRR